MYHISTPHTTNTIQQFDEKKTLLSTTELNESNKNNICRTLFTSTHDIRHYFARNSCTYITFTTYYPLPSTEPLLTCRPDRNFLRSGLSSRLFILSCLYMSSSPWVFLFLFILLTAHFTSIYKIPNDSLQLSTYNNLFPNNWNQMIYHVHYHHFSPHNPSPQLQQNQRRSFQTRSSMQIKASLNIPPLPLQEISDDFIPTSIPTMHIQWSGQYKSMFATWTIQYRKHLTYTTSTLASTSAPKRILIADSRGREFRISWGPQRYT